MFGPHYVYFPGSAKRYKIASGVRKIEGEKRKYLQLDLRCDDFLGGAESMMAI